MRESLLEGMQENLQNTSTELDASLHKTGLERGKKLASSGLKAKVQALLEILEKDPWQKPPPLEKLVGDLSGSHSRQINI